MNNLEFVKKFVAATKSGDIVWESVSRNMNIHYERSHPGDTIEQAFSVDRYGNYVVIKRDSAHDEFGHETGYMYSLIILDFSYNELYRITEDSLLDGEDGVVIPITVSNKHLLSRLYRLAERSAKHIDSLLEQLTSGLNGMEDDT